MRMDDIAQCIIDSKNYKRKYPCDKVMTQSMQKLRDEEIKQRVKYII